MTKSTKPTAIIAASSPETISFIDKIIGGILLIIFIVVWLSSAGSPVIVAVSIYHHYYTNVVIIVLITIASHLPWDEGPISRAMKYLYNKYHLSYYKSTTVVFEDVMNTNSQTFYAIHPHGAFCLGWSILFCSYFMDNVRFCFAPSLYASPFFRLFSRLVGNPGSASKSAMTQYFKKSESLALPPGGFEEATLTSTQKDRVFIKKRTGFVKLCLMHGVPIRPVYAFGESKLYSNVQGAWTLRLKLNRYGIPAILVYGLPFLPILPKNNLKMYVVVGKPLLLPKIESPTREQVELWHKKYVMALMKLYEDHKEDAYGAQEAKVAKLEIW